jgi:hypothetical protein
MARTHLADFQDRGRGDTVITRCRRSLTGPFIKHLVLAHLHMTVDQPIKTEIDTLTYRSRPSAGALIGLLLAAVVVVFMYGATTESVTSTLPWNQGDPALNTWILAWESHAVVKEPGRFFEGNIFHPFGEAIKYSEMMLPLVPFFGLVDALSGNPLLAHNLSVLALALLCLISTYRLALRLVGGMASIVAAVSFTFSGYVFIHQSHLQLLTLGFFPLAFLALFRLLEHQRVRDGVWLGVSSALLTTASFYYGAIWFVCMGVVLLVDVFRLRWPVRSWWRSVGWAAVVSVVLIGPFAYVYGSFQSDGGFLRDPTGFELRPLDFVTPAPGSVVYGDLFDWSIARQTTGAVEHGFFLGFAVLALAAIGMVIFTTDRRWRGGVPGERRVRYELLLLIVAGLVSLFVAIGTHLFGLPLPLQFLRDWVPGFDAMRAVSRLAVPLSLAISVMAAWGLSRLLRGRTPDVAMLTIALVTSVVLAELYVEPLTTEIAPRPDAIEALAASPQGAVVELPMREVFDAEFALDEGPRLLASLGDWRPRFNGFSGSVPDGYMDFVTVLNRFPDDNAIRAIGELGFRYVVLHGGLSRTDITYSFDELETRLGSLPDNARVDRYGDSWLVDLQAEE